MCVGWQKCVEDNAGIKVDELKRGSRERDTSPELEAKEMFLQKWKQSLPRLPVCSVLR